jgi:hypothetical protein
LYDLDGAQHGFMSKTFNLFTIQELLSSPSPVSATVPVTHGSIGNAAYVPIKGTAYDGLDRTQAEFSTDVMTVYT